MKQLLLTPAPTHHGQVGRRRNGRWYRADYNHAGRLCWRAIPPWRLLTLFELHAYKHRGRTFIKLATIKGIK
jgi:hypothetical protein